MKIIIEQKSCDRLFSGGELGRKGTKEVGFEVGMEVF